MKKGILLLLAAAWGLSLQASGGAGRMKGCWADTANRQWTHAFFDRFAIFQKLYLPSSVIGGLVGLAVMSVFPQ